MAELGPGPYKVGAIAKAMGSTTTALSTRSTTNHKASAPADVLIVASIPGAVPAGHWSHIGLTPDKPNKKPSKRWVF